MKKKLIMSILSLTLALGLTGCGDQVKNDGKSNTEINTSNRFQLTGEYFAIDGDKFNVVVDTKTKNLYLLNSDNTYGSNEVKNLVPFYDETGQIAKQK